MTDLNQKQWENLCDNLTWLRMAQNLTLDKLASATKVPEKVLKDVESKLLTRSFSTRHLLRLCQFYNVHPADLFCDKEKPKDCLRP